MKQLKLALALSLLSILWCHAQIPTEGLVVFLPLDLTAENTTDITEDGTIIGTLTGAEDRFGASNKALFFDGQSNYVQFQNEPALNISEAITISVWIKPSSVGSGDFTALVNKWEGLPTPPYGKGYYLGINNAAGTVTRWNTGSVSADGPPIPMDEWTHLVATYDSDSMKIYKNCVLETAKPAIAPVFPTVVPFRLGKQSEDWGEDFYHGIMDEVLVYNRSLPLEEIEQICSYDPTAVAENILAPDLSVYPNPFDQELRFNSPTVRFSHGVLTDMRGKVWRQFDDITSSYSIAVQDLPKGSYILQLYTPDGKQISRKVVKM